MVGPYDNVSTGEVRLVNADTHQRSFTRDGLDLFLVTAKNVGLPNSIKVGGRASTVSKVRGST